MKSTLLIFAIVFYSILGSAHSMVHHQPPLKDQVIEHAQRGPLEIIKEGHPTLRLIAEPITEAELSSDEFQKFLDDLEETMLKSGGVGIAAPQVNVSKRVFVALESHIVNPEVTFYEDRGTKQSSEGCLSIPGKKYIVPRYKELHIDYFNRHGEFISEDVTGFRATVIQHEFDHLNGILISDFADSFEFIDEFDESNTPLL
ncbi:MAG: peptide deformylase [Bdellovibrionales bacterium]